MTTEKITIISDNEPMTAALDSLQVGQVIAFSSKRYSSLRAVSSTRGFETGKQFSTKIDRANNYVLVSRIS